jgi:hypothetical protein
MLMLLIIKISRCARNDKKENYDTVSKAGIQAVFDNAGSGQARNDNKGKR